MTVAVHIVGEVGSVEAQQFMSLLVGVALTLVVLAALGALAVAFGADSRTPVGDDHGQRVRGDWT
jgi:hypothetical protein